MSSLNNQIPIIHRYINETKSSRTLLTSSQYDTTFHQLDNGTFKYYGETLNFLLTALDKYSPLNKSIVFFGLTDVNCDAIAIWKGAKEVFVVDYNLPVSEHPKVKVFSHADYLNNNFKADIGISISSFEHDGLGRYGDRIDPNGDIEAMSSAKKFIKEDGLLFLSVPVGRDCLVWNAHRIYGPIRLPLLLKEWEEVTNYGFSDALYEQKLERHVEPVFVLKNI